MLILVVFLVQKKTRYQFVPSMTNEGNNLEHKKNFLRMTERKSVE